MQSLLRSAYPVAISLLDWGVAGNWAPLSWGVRLGLSPWHSKKDQDDNTEGPTSSKVFSKSLDRDSIV